MIRIDFHFNIRLQGWHGWRTGKRKGKGVISYGNRHFGEFALRIIREQQSTRSKSTTDNYMTAVRSLLKYAGSNMTIESVNRQMLEGYQLWLQEQGLSLNAISCYMRSLRCLLGLMGVDSRTLFKSVFTGNCRTEKRAISTDELQKLRQLKIEKGNQLALVRDLFLFSVYSLGMPFVDIAFLRKSQISEEYITYCRHKTGQRIRIRIEPPMQEIIICYKTPEGNPFLFPLLQKGSMDEYERVRSWYNRQLRRLSLQAGLSKRLTSYVARHSWATMAYHANVDLPVISKAMGHTSSNTTLTYIREIDDCRIDEANQKLISQFV